MPSTKSKTKQKHNIQFESLGTHWYIESSRLLDSDIRQRISTSLETFDKTWSRFRSDSMVSEINRSAGTYNLDIDGRQLMGWYSTLYDLSDGLVTPLIGQTLADSGYDASYRLTPNDSIATTPHWEDVLSLDATSLTITTPCLLDVGAAGKGKAVDIVSEILTNGGHTEFTVDAGGDIYINIRDSVIGLEHPNDSTKIIGTITIDQGSICGSASNRRAWGDLHHIIDPTTSEPTRNVVATWAIAESAMIADGLATALFFVAPDVLERTIPFRYVVVHNDGTMLYSKHKDITLFN